MLVLLLLFISPLINANVSPPQDSDILSRMTDNAINRMTSLATKLIDDQIDQKAGKISQIISKILHPLKKSSPNPEIKRHIKDFLSETFGNPLKEEIPGKIRENIQDGTDQIASNSGKLPSGFNLSTSQIDQVSSNFSQTLASRTSFNFKDLLNGKWKEFKKNNTEKANRTDACTPKHVGTNKPKFLDRIKQKFASLDLKPERV